jgi:FkbM family methyltransferase
MNAGDDQRRSDETSPNPVLRLHDLNLLGTAANYDLTDKADRRRSFADLSKFFLSATRALSPGLFIEAGAKDASTSRRARRYLDHARIVAFEANPYTYEAFRSKNGDDSGIEYVHLALSDKPGPVTFNVRLFEDGKPRPDGHGSLMERDDSYDSDFTPVTVEATTLDDFFADYEFDSCALWVDVEGATSSVLSGGRRVLEKASVLFIEVEDGALWKDAWQKSDVAAFLYDAGMLPLARDFESRYQYNMVFVRESLLDHPQLRLRYTQHVSSLATRRPTPPEQPARGGARPWVGASGRVRRWLRRVAHTPRG